MKTDIFLPCMMVYFCQSIIPAGSRGYRFLNTGSRDWEKASGIAIATRNVPVCSMHRIHITSILEHMHVILDNRPQKYLLFHTNASSLNVAIMWHRYVNRRRIPVHKGHKGGFIVLISNDDHCANLTGKFMGKIPNFELFLEPYTHNPTDKNTNGKRECFFLSHFTYISVGPAVVLVYEFFWLLCTFAFLGL